jgi:hypothetical protein
MNRALRSASLSCTLLVLAGCESAQYGSDLSASPRPRVIDATGNTIKLPDETPFSITLPESRERPLLNGKADAKCAAEKSGAGLASADVQTGGVAEALFRVGHAIQNGTPQEISLTCKVRFAYEFEVGTSAVTAASDGVVGLRLYARDAQGRLLRSVPLVDYTSADGAVRRSGNEDVVVELALSSGNTINLFVAGQARVDVPEERSAKATIALRELKMEIAKNRRSANGE